MSHRDNAGPWLASGAGVRRDNGGSAYTAPAQHRPAAHTGLAKYGQWSTHQHGDLHECGVIDSRKFGHNNNIIRG